MYDEDLYGQQGYADDSHDESVTPEPTRLVDLEKYVPDFVTDLGEMHQIYTTQGYEIGREQLLAEDMMEQAFPNTSTWELTRWEKLLGITPNENLSDELRRKVIKRNMLAVETTTAKLLENVGADLTGIRIWVEEVPEKYHINVFMMSRDQIPNNLGIYRTLIEKLKPAHLTYTLTFFATRWKDIKSLTWREARGYTWNGLAIGKKDPIATWGGVRKLSMTFRDLKNQTWTSTKNLEEAKEEV